MVYMTFGDVVVEKGKWAGVAGVAELCQAHAYFMNDFNPRIFQFLRDSIQILFKDSFDSDCGF